MCCCSSWWLLHVLRHRRRSDSTLLWLFITWTVPVMGTLLYAMFGVDRVPKERWRRTVQRHDRMEGARQAATDDVLPEAYWRSVGGAPTTPEDPWAREVDRPLAALSESFPLLKGNLITPLLTGDEAFPKMLDAIREARHHIHLQSFIIGNDEVGREFMEAMAERRPAPGCGCGCSMTGSVPRTRCGAVCSGNTGRCQT